MNQKLFKFNKKGATLSFWIEIILLIIVFVVALGFIGVSMNGWYGQNHDLTYGLSTNSTLTEIENYQNTVANSTTEGQASLTSFGFFILSTVPHMLLTARSVITNFITGGFINQLVNLMNLGQFGGIIIVAFRLLYFLAIGFILIKLILKIQA